MTQTDWAKEYLKRWSQVAKSYGMRTGRALSTWRFARIRKARELEEDLDIWEAAFREIGRNPFFTGQNKRQWKCDVEYTLRDEHMAKVLDAGYDAVEVVAQEDDRRMTAERTAQEETRLLEEQRAARRVIK